MAYLGTGTTIMVDSEESTSDLFAEIISIKLVLIKSRLDVDICLDPNKDPTPYLNEFHRYTLVFSNGAK